MSLILNKFIHWVLPGVLLVLANFLDFVIAFIMVDFPTFDLPTKQHSGTLLFGIRSTALKEPIKLFLEKNKFSDLLPSFIFC